MTQKSKQAAICVCIVLAAFLFSTMEIALKFAGAQFDAIQLTFLRFLIGGAILLPFAISDLKKRQVKLVTSDYVYMLLLGIVCICFSMVLFQIGVMRTNASLSAVIIAANPVFTMIFAHFMTEDKFTRKKALILVLNIIGLTVVANPFDLGEGNDLIGILLVVIASIAFGLYSAMGKLRVGKIGGMAQNSISFLLGSFVMLVILIVMQKPIIAGVTADNILLVLYVGIFVTGIGYYCFVKAIELSSPSTASIAFFIKPALALILAYIILGEAITANKVVGVIIIICASTINLIKPKKRVK